MPSQGGISILFWTGRELAVHERSISLPGPGLTAPNKWELQQAEQPKEATRTKRRGYPAFCQIAF